MKSNLAINSYIRQKIIAPIKIFIKANLIGLGVFTAATLLFFGPILPQLSTYSEGGDAMFNAWTLSRNHNCILGNNCENYTDGNIFYPNKDTFLYSETQLSTGLLTLPLRLISENPIFANNIWTILSFFFSGFFVYLLAKYLSKGAELFPILGGLIFEFAPFKMNAVWHLQNLSIFYMPLAFLLIYKFIDSKKKKYLLWLLIVLVLQFYASWYQMVFVLIALAILISTKFITKSLKIKDAIAISLVIIIAIGSTLPLAIKYTAFSKSRGANFSITDQATYSSSLYDYAIPQNGTLLGKYYYNTPRNPINSYNPDSSSYHGMVLYVTFAAVLLLGIFAKKKKLKKELLSQVFPYVMIAIAGFIISLGPLLKLKAVADYPNPTDGVRYVVPLPWLVVEKILPQLTFIRALGRAGVLLLFSLCILLAFFPRVLRIISNYNKKASLLAKFLVIALIIIELMPAHQVLMSPHAYSYNLEIPAVYRYVKENDDIKNLIVLAGDFDYPKAGIPIAIPEQVLWSGYHNKNIYNGYSGFNPPTYWQDYFDYLDFGSEDVIKLKGLGLNHVIVDKLLSTSRPKLFDSVKSLSKKQLYEDSRYTVFEL